jgi:hypothetical protein
VTAPHASSLLLLLCAGCAPLPATLPERGLYVDLRKTVELRESDDWVIDRMEIEELAPSMARSVCQVEWDARERLLGFIEERIAAEGGPAELVYRREGSLRGVRENLRLERMHALLEHIHGLAEVDCPFWLEADPEFAGVQADEGRVVLFIETLGGVRVTFEDDEVSLGGGGGARLLLGGGIGPRFTLAFGVEGGGAGSFTENDAGTRDITATFAMGAAALLRLHMGSRVLDLDVAAVTRFLDGEVQEPGMRVGLGYGLTTLRLSNLMPYAVVWVGYERQPFGSGGHTVWIGTRVGFDWDPP